jgi:hypothetical protein
MINSGLNRSEEPVEIIVSNLRAGTWVPYRRGGKDLETIRDAQLESSFCTMIC